MNNSDVYLRAIVGLMGRQAFPPDVLAELVGREKQIDAYNLCDGSRTQSDVAGELGLDQGNFSRTLNRWIEIGIMFKVGEGREARPVHLYPLAKIGKRK